MSDISSTEKGKYDDLNAEQYELLLFRGELVEEGRAGTIEFVLPLIDKRLEEIQNALERSSWSPSSSAEYAEAVRDSEEKLAEITDQLKNAADHF